jgi:hypothetical protein
LMFNLCSATSFGIPFMSEGFHANTSRFTLRKSTSALSYLGSSVVPIWSVRPLSETTASLTSLAGSNEQAYAWMTQGHPSPRIEARRGASWTGWLL